MANQKISLSTVKGLSTGDVYLDLDVQSEAVQKTITNKNAIRQSIHNILTFSPRERVLYPEFGNRLKDFVFDRITDGVMSNIKSAIEEMLKDEPRVKCEKIEITPNIDANELSVSVYYSIPALSEMDSASISVVGNVG